MPKPLTPLALDTRDVSITSATVSLKTVQVSKKQMTLSVFRQLEECKLVDTDNVSLNGTVWGYVRYYWGDMGTGATHFLVQQGTILRRALFTLRDLPAHGDYWPNGWSTHHDNLEWIYTAIIYAKLLGGWRPEGYGAPDRWAQTRKKVPGLGFEFQFKPPENLSRFLGEDWNQQELRRAQKLGREPDEHTSTHAAKAILVGEECRQDMERYLAKFPTVSVEGLTGLFVIEVTKAEAYAARWNALMNELRQAEQLFIAC